MPLQQAKVTKFELRSYLGCTRDSKQASSPLIGTRFLLFYLSEGENFIKGLLGPIEGPTWREGRGWVLAHEHRHSHQVERAALGSPSKTLNFSSKTSNQ